MLAFLLHALVPTARGGTRARQRGGNTPDWGSQIGAKVISHGRYLVFQMAGVAVPRELFGRLLYRIARLRPPSPVAC
jgi:hypothetical protein